MPKILVFSSISRVILLFKSIFWNILWELTYFFNIRKRVFRIFILHLQYLKQLYIYAWNQTNVEYRRRSKNFLQKDFRKFRLRNGRGGYKVLQCTCYKMHANAVFYSATSKKETSIFGSYVCVSVFHFLNNHCRDLNLPFTLQLKYTREAKRNHHIVYRFYRDTSNV